MMKKKCLAAVLAVLTLAVLLAGCHSTAPSSAAPSGTEPSSAQGQSTGGEHFIGYSCMTFEDAYLVDTGNKLREMCEANGYQYTEMGAEGVASKQVEQIENMVTMGCDIICVCPIDVDALLDVFTKAREQGVRIVFVGDPLETKDAFDVAVNVSQYDFGVSAAQAAADWIDASFPDAEDGSIEVAVFENSSNDLFQQRAEGLKQVEELTSKAKIVEVYDLAGQQNSGAKCQEYADALFLSHPDCKVVLSHSSDYATSIDEVVLRTAGLDAQQMGIFGCDWLQAAADSIALSPEGGSALRAIIDSGDLGVVMFQAAMGELEVDENGFSAMPLTTVTVENVEDVIASHQ